MQGTPADAASVSGEHLGLTVRLDGEAWLVDVALAGGLYDPVPLREGTYVQAPFTVALAPSEVAPGGWRFLHDARGPFTAVDFAPEPVEMASFSDMHEHLSTSPESGFVRVLTAQLRDAAGLFVLRGRLLRRIDATGAQERTIDSAEELLDVLAGVFRIDPSGVTRAERARLWRRVGEQHRAWEEKAGARP